MIKRYVRYLLVFVFCLFVSPFTIHAACDYQRMAELSKVASNVQVGYAYEVKDNIPVFYLNVSNVTNDIYMVDNFGNVYRQNAEGIQIFPGVNVTFNIYSNDSNCPGDKLLTKYLNLPFYNKYSSYPECASYKDYSACQIWTSNAPVTDGEFYEQIASYKNETYNNQNADNGDTNTNFIQEHLIFIIAGALAIIGILSAILIWRKRK